MARKPVWNDVPRDPDNKRFTPRPAPPPPAPAPAEPK